jgi:predicted ATPase
MPAAYQGECPKIAPHAEAHPARTGGAGAYFVGRRRELADVRSAIEDAQAGRGRLLLFTGEPGIGKTRLADESTNLATASGMQVRWGRCWEGGGAPAHWPWIQVIREVIAESGAPGVGSRSLPVEIARILPERSSEVPESKGHLDAEQARFRLFDAQNRLLLNVARASNQRDRPR